MSKLTSYQHFLISEQATLRLLEADLKRVQFLDPVRRVWSLIKS